MTDPWSLAEDVPPISLVPGAGAGAPRFAYPERFRPRLVVATLHDGDNLPAHLLASPEAERLRADGTLWRHYVEERDWGADLVAGHLAAALGLAGHHRVNVARLVMDFNRFPGTTPPEAGPMDRFAIGDPLGACLGHAEKRRVLEDYYDRVSEGLEEAILGALIVLSVHTYDEHNASRTRRPEVSLLSRSNSYQQASRLPHLLFDPLFPDILVESSAKRILRDRIALTLEKAGIYVEHNYPYCLPDGSFEVRSQPWFFFQHVRALYEDDHPGTRGDPAHELVWHMLLNTNLRRADAGTLAGYLHRFRQAPRGREAELEAARRAYEGLARWLAARPGLADDYRMSPERTSAVCVEVRKDLVWRFDEDGRPLGPDDARAREVAERLAESIAAYLREDRG